MMKRTLEMRRLEAFCSVVELGSFTKAADHLGLSQPTVSEHVRNLEESIDDKLLDRMSREIAITPAGEIFYRRAKEILAIRDKALEELDEFGDSLSGELTVGASTIPGAYILPSVIGSFKTEHPNVGFNLQIGSSASILTAVIDGLCEVGVIGHRGHDQKVQAEEIFYDDLALTVWPEHPWTNIGEIKLEQLAGEPFILREKGSGTRSVMFEILESKGFDPSTLNVVSRLGGGEAVRQGIKEKLGISVISRLAIKEDIQSGRLSVVNVQNISWRRPFFLVSRKNRRLSPACKAFVNYVRSLKNSWNQRQI